MKAACFEQDGGSNHQLELIITGNVYSTENKDGPQVLSIQSTVVVINQDSKTRGKLMEEGNSCGSPYMLRG